MNVWKLMLHHEKEKYDKQVSPEIRNEMLYWTIREGRIALGWGEVSNVLDCDFTGRVRPSNKKHAHIS